MQGQTTRRDEHQWGPTLPNDKGANDTMKAQTAGYDSTSGLTTAQVGYDSTSGLTTAPGGYDSASKAMTSTGRSTQHDQGGSEQVNNDASKQVNDNRASR